MKKILQLFKTQHISTHYYESREKNCEKFKLPFSRVYRALRETYVKYLYDVTS